MGEFAEPEKLLFGRAYRLLVSPQWGGVVEVAQFGKTGLFADPSNPPPPIFEEVRSTTALDVSALRCTFKVKKSVRPEPNTATIEVYNLAAESRAVLAMAEKLVVRLEAGYGDTGTSVIYVGDVRSAWTEWEGPTCKTTIATGDGEKEMKEARLNLTIGAGVPVDHVMLHIAKGLGVGDGNLEEAAAMLRKSVLGTAIFGPGTVFAGNTARELTEICRSVGLEWSIQDGKLQILKCGQPVNGGSEQAVELTSKTGLIGSPTIDFNASSKTKKGGVFVKAKTLIIPDLLPGRKVVFDSKEVRGGFRIEEIEYDGDTHGQSWYANLTCKSY